MRKGAGLTCAGSGQRRPASPSQPRASPIHEAHGEEGSPHCTVWTRLFPKRSEMHCQRIKSCQIKVHLFKSQNSHCVLDTELFTLLLLELFHAREDHELFASLSPLLSLYQRHREMALHDVFIKSWNVLNKDQVPVGIDQIPSKGP